MGLKSLLFFQVVFLPSLLAFKATFKNGDVAEYELLEIEDKNSVQFLQGLQAFIRFAKVVSIPEGYAFNKGEEVALKIGYANKEADIRREQKAHDIIQEKAEGGFIEGVVRAEKSLAVSLNLKDEPNLVLPEGHVAQESYCILIMERMGLDMVAMYSKGFAPKDLEAIYDGLSITLDKLKSVGIAHGDIKPENILFMRSNNVIDGVKLTDFGLAVFENFGITSCGGDVIYMSPIQHMAKRPATFDDCEVSLAFLMAYVGTAHLPWIEFYKDSLLKLSEQKYNFHQERILVAKFEFMLNPFATFQIQQSPILKEKICETIGKITSQVVEKIHQCIYLLKNEIGDITE